MISKPKTVSEVTGTRTPGTSDTCEYRNCPERPGAGEVRGCYLIAHPLPWTMCAEHLHPKWHAGKAITDITVVGWE
jgi:hypothetical protein